MTKKYGFDILRLKGDAPDENYRQRGVRPPLHLAIGFRAPRGASQRCRNCASGRGSVYVEAARDLKKAGFTKSHRGVKGGYVLARPPEQISLGDVERALGGLWTTEDIRDCYTGQRRTCIHDKDCRLRPVCAWKGITQYVVGVMDGIPISQILSNKIFRTVVAKYISLRLLRFRAHELFFGRET